MAKVGMLREDDGYVREDGTLVRFDALEGKDRDRARVRVRGLPEGTAVTRLGSWLNATEVMALAAVVSGDRPAQQDRTAVYAVNVMTGEARELDNHPPFPHILIPGIVM
ncbi:hypothetical protein [Planobispora rosea]|uniref:hypothetical protein n=1 Tax=Planobispora rosea TaxID=35762 RepID=UPI00083B9AC3|nr:hypothetical protein [Planobispora rosea]